MFIRLKTDYFSTKTESSLFIQILSALLYIIPTLNQTNSEQEYQAQFDKGRS